MHLTGHFAGHFGASFPSLIQRLLPFDLDYLWLGVSTDEIQDEVLLAVGGATEGNVPTGYNPGPLDKALFQFGATTDAWQAQDAAVGDFVNTAITITIFRAQGPLAGIANLVGKRAAGAPNAGKETKVAVNGQVQCDAGTTGGSAFASVPDDHVSSTLPHVVVCRARPGFLDLATENGMDSKAIAAGSWSNADLLAVGRQRVLTDPAIEVGFVGLVADAPGLDTLDIVQGVLWPIARELILEPVFDDDGAPVFDVDDNQVYAHSYPYV